MPSGWSSNLLWGCRDCGWMTGYSEVNLRLLTQALYNFRIADNPGVGRSLCFLLVLAPRSAKDRAEFVLLATSATR